MSSADMDIMTWCDDTVNRKLFKALSGFYNYEYHLQIRDQLMENWMLCNAVGLIFVKLAWSPFEREVTLQNQCKVLRRCSILSNFFILNECGLQDDCLHPQGVSTQWCG